jgi:hypothetical protein
LIVTYAYALRTAADIERDWGLSILSPLLIR